MNALSTNEKTPEDAIRNRFGYPRGQSSCSVVYSTVYKTVGISDGSPFGLFGWRRLKTTADTTSGVFVQRDRELKQIGKLIFKNSAI